MNRRIVTLLAALGPIVVLGVFGTVTVVPYVALGPGPTFNTLGEVGGEEVVAIEGTDVDETSGHLNMTTVAVRDDLNVFEAFGLWASGRQGIVPREEVYPPDRSKDEVQQENEADFQRSEDSAELAALHFLGEPVDLRISQVVDDGPSTDVLRAGDQLVSVNGAAVSTVGDVQQAVAAVAPSTEVSIVVTRDAVETTVPVVLGPRPDDNSKGYLGITPEEVPDVPFTIDFNLADVGGPSAGLMFALAVIDKLSPGDLNGGKFVAGTGTIDSDGEVGPIGGIKYKLIAASEAGAETFLVPAQNCDEARQGAPDGLRLVKVENLDGAIDALEAVNAGAAAPLC
ncbi:YlbL family protein [Rhodococcus marinonascens]|uniref:YlbL family protein n=1 Tax=Rhodococcus marinonascens TaxID=38311 RepID=UPI0009334B25|nr:PDZ domain-containing protein [Rhodococcus marinonascens]